jgi:hypothetical protein
MLFVWRRPAAPGGLAAATSAAVCTLVRAELITLRGTQLPAFGILIAGYPCRYDGRPTVMTAFISASSGPHARSARLCMVARRVRQVYPGAASRPWPPERHGYEDVVRHREAVCGTAGFSRRDVRKAQI